MHEYNTSLIAVIQLILLPIKSVGISHTTHLITKVSLRENLSMADNAKKYYTNKGSDDNKYNGHPYTSYL